MFGQDGSFAPPSQQGASASALPSGSRVAPSTASAGQAYLDSLMGITGPSSTYAAPVYTASSFAKNVRDTVLGSSIANSKAGASSSSSSRAQAQQAQQQRSLLSAGNAVGTNSRSSKLGPAVTVPSGANALKPAGTAASSSAASSAAANTAAASNAAYNEDLLDNDEAEEDQLLYEGGGGDDGDYDDYDDEYY